MAVLPPNLLPFASALSLASNGLRVSREPNDDGTRPAAGQALKTRAPAGLTTDERARLPQPHNERCHQHDDGWYQQKLIPWVHATERSYGRKKSR